MKKKIYITILATLTALTMAACNTATPQTSRSEQTEAAVTTEAETEKTDTSDATGKDIPDTKDDMGSAAKVIDDAASGSISEGNAPTVENDLNSMGGEADEGEPEVIDDWIDMSNVDEDSPFFIKINGDPENLKINANYLKGDEAEVIPDYYEDAALKDMAAKAQAEGLTIEDCPKLADAMGCCPILCPFGKTVKNGFVARKIEEGESESYTEWEVGYIPEDLARATIDWEAKDVPTDGTDLKRDETDDKLTLSYSWDLSGSKMDLEITYDKNTNLYISKRHTN